MPTMHKENDWAIRVNGDEPHPLPHAHVGFRDGSRVSVCIETRAVLVRSIGQQHGWHQRWLGLRRTKTNFLQSTGG